MGFSLRALLFPPTTFAKGLKDDLKAWWEHYYDSEKLCRVVKLSSGLGKTSIVHSR